MARADVSLRHASASSRGAGSSRPRASTSSSGSTRSWTSCTPAASPSTSPPRPRPRRRGSPRAHPEILPVDVDGHTLWPGSRQTWCPTSPVFREYALALTRQLATRYHDHPALAMWHVSNEYACHNLPCYCDSARAHFRAWLRRRYESLDALNDAWGTAFWSQRYTDWEQILPPRRTTTFNNPTHVLDYKRFSSDALLELLRAEQRGARRALPRRAGDDELHDARATSATSTTRSGPRPVTSSAPTTTSSTRLDAPAGRAGVQRRPDPRARRWRARGCSWSTRRARSTGSPSTTPRRPARRSATRSPTWPAAPTPSACSSGASRGPARRSSTAPLVPHAGADSARFREVVRARRASPCGSASSSAAAWSPGSRPAMGLPGRLGRRRARACRQPELDYALVAAQAIHRLLRDAG